MEARIYGPYLRTESGCEFLLGLVDPVSGWVEALAVPAGDCCARLADFIFRTFCTLGFAQCALIGVSEQQFEELHDRWAGDGGEETGRAGEVRMLVVMASAVIPVTCSALVILAN